MGHGTIEGLRRTARDRRRRRLLLGARLRGDVGARPCRRHGDRRRQPVQRLRRQARPVHEVAGALRQPLDARAYRPARGAAPAEGGDPRLPGRDHRPLAEGPRPPGLPAGQLRPRRGAARRRDRARGGGLSRRAPRLLPPQHRGRAPGGPGAGQPRSPTRCRAICWAVVLGIRVLARTGAKRRLLEGVARPALDLLDFPRKAH